MIRITWSNGFIQVKTITRCLKGYQYITMNSPIYKAIEDGSLTIDLGYGKHSFTVDYL